MPTPKKNSDTDNLNERRLALGTADGLGYRRLLESRIDLKMEAAKKNSTQAAFLDVIKSDCKEALKIFDHYKERFDKLDEAIQAELATLPVGSEDYKNMVNYAVKVQNLRVQTLRTLSNPDYFKETLKGNSRALRNKIVIPLKAALIETGAHQSAWAARSEQHVNDILVMMKQSQYTKQSVAHPAKISVQDVPSEKTAKSTTIPFSESLLGNLAASEKEEHVSIVESPLEPANNDSSLSKTHQEKAMTKHEDSSSEKEQLLLAKIGEKMGGITGTLLQMGIKFGFKAAVAGLDGLIGLCKKGIKAGYHALTDKTPSQKSPPRDKMLSKVGHSIELQELNQNKDKGASQDAQKEFSAPSQPK